MRLPEIVAAADWSVSGERRRVAVASLAPDGSYLAGLPDTVGPTEELVHRLRTQVGSQGVALLGVDFPIGLPSAYARKAGLPSFREALELFGRDNSWADFFQPTDHPTIKRPFGPTSNVAGGMTRDGLARSLGLSVNDLLRRCDRRTPTRRQAEMLFYTRFAKQVGRAATHGWQYLLQPHAVELRLWPFDGRLATLVNEAGIVVAEVYPAEAATHLRLNLGPGTNRSKGRREDRAAVAATLVVAAGEAGLHFTPQCLAGIADGFDGSDDFDAVVALVSIVMVFRGIRPQDPPTEDDILRIEGWTLGLDIGQSQGAEVSAPRVWIPSDRLAASNQQSYYIRNFRWGTGPNEAISLAHPEGDRGALNVLCGLNNAGKSFLLEQLRRLVQGKAHVPAFTLEPQPHGRPPRLLVFGRAWDAKDNIGIINLEQRRSALDLPQRYGDYRRVGLTLLASHMADHIAGLPASEAVSHLLEPSIRQQIRDAFPPEREIFRCRPDPLVQRLEAILDANLYFRCAKRDASGAAWQFEFVLLDADGNTVPYLEWSEGQKACFYILTSLDILRPDIVLFDEVENHLHPAYMSEVLGALRAHPIQSIVATHHPHLIFSRFVDRVFYIETRRPGRRQEPPRAISYSKRRADAAFSREAKHLVHDLHRIAAAYGLFAEHDDLLLRTSIDATHRSTLTLLGALASLFEPRPAGPSSRPVPDTQTQQLASLVQSFAFRSPRGSVRILDLGAGVGRQVMELGKLSEWQLGAEVEWTCYEPFADARSKLKECFGGRRVVRIIDSLSEVSDQLFDFCVLANVLHELTPPEFVDYLEAADRHTDHGDGGIVILELFPLTKPEGFAVPYEGGLLRDALDVAGFLTDGSVTPLRMAGIAAHWVVARRKNEAVPIAREVLEEQVRVLWDHTLERALSAYALRQAPTTLDRYQSLLSNLTTIASIEAWRRGKWLQSGNDSKLP